MKRCYWLRHGKSSWDSGAANDASRPLAPRGRRAAREMGQLITRLGEEPQRLLASPAQRATATARLASEAGGWHCPIEIDDALYGRGVEPVLRTIAATDDAVDRLLLVGHEPTWSSAVACLIGGGHVRMVTAGLARVDLEIDRWSSVRAASGQLIWLMAPKPLERAMPKRQGHSL